MCGGSTVPFGAPYGHFADAASTIKEAHHPRVLAWGPAGDHTLCAMVNDLRVCEPLARRSPCHTPAVTWGNALPRFTGRRGDIRSCDIRLRRSDTGRVRLHGGSGEHDAEFAAILG